MLFVPRKAKTTVFTMCYLQCFLDSTEQKHRYLRSFRHVERSYFSMQSHKAHVNYNVLGLILGFVTGWGGGPEMNSNRLNNQVTGLASLPFTS